MRGYITLMQVLVYLKQFTRLPICLSLSWLAYFDDQHYIKSFLETEQSGMSLVFFIVICGNLLFYVFVSILSEYSKLVIISNCPFMTL